MASIQSTTTSPSANTENKLVLVAHTTVAAVTKRRRSNATASETQYTLKPSMGKATSVKVDNGKRIKVAVTGPGPDEDEDRATASSEDARVTVADLGPDHFLYTEIGAPPESWVPEASIRITIVDDNSEDDGGAVLTHLSPIPEDQVTVPREPKEEIIRPSLELKQYTDEEEDAYPSVLLPSLCGPPTPMDGGFAIPKLNFLPSLMSPTSPTASEQDYASGEERETEYDSEDDSENEYEPRRPANRASDSDDDSEVDEGFNTFEREFYSFIAERQISFEADPVATLPSATASRSPSPVYTDGDALRRASPSPVADVPRAPSRAASIRHAVSSLMRVPFKGTKRRRSDESVKSTDENVAGSGGEEQEEEDVPQQKKRKLVSLAGRRVFRPLGAR